MQKLNETGSETALERQLLEAFDELWDNFVDPADALYDAAGSRWSLVGGEPGPGGASGVPFANEQQLREIRDQCRVLATTNEFAINGHENRIRKATCFLQGRRIRGIYRNTAGAKTSGGVSHGARSGGGLGGSPENHARFGEQATPDSGAEGTGSIGSGTRLDSFGKEWSSGRLDFGTAGKLPAKHRSQVVGNDHRLTPGSGGPRKGWSNMVNRICPVCAGPWPDDDQPTHDEAPNRPCPKCRSIEGTLSELAVTWGCVEQDYLPRESLNRYAEWPSIEHLACKVFGQPSFTRKTWKRLESFLRTEHAKSRQEMLGLPRSKVVELLRRECECVAAVGNNVSAVLIPLTQEDKSILEAMAAEGSMAVTQENLAASIRVSEKTIGKRLKYLRENGLAEQPLGKRKGHVITKAGLQAIGR